MITGSVSFAASLKLSCSDSSLFSQEISFQKVENGFFEGGFYLNNRLPLKPQDIFYVDETRDILILLSGSIFNRDEFINSGNGSSHMHDPELIANLFLKQGPSFVKKLNGDFVIFILSSLGREAFLFRDHLGIRPVAWIRQGEVLTFSMDIIDLCKRFGVERPIDSEFLLGYFKYIDYRRTPFSGVRKLLPGHYISFSEAGFSCVKYWDPEKIKIERGISYEKTISDLDALVRDSVRIRADLRYLASAHISSGLDSGVVSVLARKEYGNQDHFYGFSWSPASFTSKCTGRDECEIISSICLLNDIIPVFSDLEITKFQKLVSEFYYNQGYFAEAETTEQAGKLGVNLIFTGWGGDEFISSGHSGIDLDLLARLKLGLFFRRNRLFKPRRFIRHLLFFVVYPAFHILDPASAKAFRQDVRYIRDPLKSSDREAIKRFYFHRSRRQMHLNVLRFYNLPERCENWYINGFRKGIEYRYPLLDRRIIEYMLKVPSEHLCRTGHFRPLLREIGKGILPDMVRMNNDKNDPVFWAFWSELIRDTALSYFGETESWKSNPDLQFIDFDRLLEDIEHYKNDAVKQDEKVLFRSVVYIKAINEFTKQYRKSS